LKEEKIMVISECSWKNPALRNGRQSCSTGNRKKSLIVDDEPLIRLSLKKLFEKEGALVFTAGSGTAALKIFENERPEIVVLDVRLPDCSGLDILKTVKDADPETIVIMITGHADIKSSVEAMKMGASDFLEKPLDFEKIGKMVRTLTIEKPSEHGSSWMGGLVCASSSMKEVMRIADSLAAKSDVTILLLGESGTGKNILCKRIHELSSRRNMPFVEIGCSQIPDHLLESELFGYNKGAFTDARETKKGLFELAHGGTVLLDEIGDMPLQMQSKVLTMIEEKKFRRIGGLDFMHADVRILAATNRDLPELVQSKKFRLDLFYRLNVAAIEIPPLRERKKDIPVLLEHYVKESCEKYNVRQKALSEEAMSWLQEYDWPGNVRELKNLIERVVILSKEDRIGIDDIQPCLFSGKRGVMPQEMNGNKNRNSTSLKVMEEHMIQEAFELSHGNQRKTAKLLDISRDTLRYRLKKMGLTNKREKRDPNK
jgi:two-component system, NtrC family, response regulator AtoC